MIPTPKKKFLNKPSTGCQTDKWEPEVIEIEKVIKETVIKEVPVPFEVIKEVIKEIHVPYEVIKEVTKEVEVPVI